jgi:TetR/AcrR family transcriptional repressor of nem operon
MMAIGPQHESKTKLLNAAPQAIRTSGYAATTADDICHWAGVTKGSLLHHFKTQDELAIAAVERWNAMTGGFFATASCHQAKDPLDRLFGYVAFRAAILTDGESVYTCLLGTLVQEVYATHPDIRTTCERGMVSHIAELTRDIEAAKRRYAPGASWSAESVGYFIQSVLQGAFVFAKARQGPAVVRDSLAHLRCYIELLFKPARRKMKEMS